MLKIRSDWIIVLDTVVLCFTLKLTFWFLCNFMIIDMDKCDFLFLILYSLTIFEVPASLSHKDVETIKDMYAKWGNNYETCGWMCQTWNQSCHIPFWDIRSRSPLNWENYQHFWNWEKLQPFRWGRKLIVSFRFSDLKNPVFTSSLFKI